MSAGDRTGTQDSQSVAREAMGESVKLSHLEVAIVRAVGMQSEQTRQLLLESHRALLDGMKDAVRDGIAEAVTDEKLVGVFVTTGIKALKSQAEIGTGRFVLGSMREWVKRWFWPAVLFLCFWYFLGWAAVKTVGAAFWQALTATK